MRVFFSFLAMFLCSSAITMVAGITEITDENFATALGQYRINKPRSEETYGKITSWDVSQVLNMG